MTLKTAWMVGGLLLAGCATVTPNPEAAPAISGPQVWAETCAQCHGFRNPGSLSDAQWDVAVTHMRLRANLTAEDAQAVLAFLKSAN